MNARISQILRLAIPSIISNITVPLLGLVDVGIVGHIGDAKYIGAIAVGTMLFNVIYWIFGFLRMGTGGMTSQAYGHRDFKEVIRLLIRTLTIGLVIGFLFIILQIPLIQFGLWIMKPDIGMLSLCWKYCLICIWGAPAVLAMNGLTGWYVGMQNTRVPMMASIGQNILNIISSLIFVFVFHMDISGVAIGTIIAQWGGLLFSLLLLHHSYKRLYKYFSWSGLFDYHALYHFFIVNRDIFIRTLFLVSVFLSFTSIGSRQGAIILAINTLLMEFFTIFSYFTDGLAYAGEALCGKYYGARNREAFREVVHHLFYLGFIVAIFFTVIYSFAGESFLSFLTTDTHVICVSKSYIGWTCLIPIVGVSAFLLDGIFVGITNTKGLLLSSVIAAILFFIVYLLLRSQLHNHALWLAFLLYLAARGIVEFILFIRQPV